jgi:cyclopropane fatty-acyl-phospholipid synthase-like methyltransferase
VPHAHPQRWATVVNPAAAEQPAGERAGGLYPLLSLGWLYHAFQLAVGASRSWSSFAQQDVRIRPGEHLLDVGCGVGDLLAHLPPGVHYFGYDKNADYIRMAKEKYGDRGVFLCEDVNTASRNWPPMDVVVSVGVLHHLTDAGADEVFTQAKSLLRPGGRFCSMDPCFTPSQSALSRLLVSRDRGRYVRTDEAYKALASRHFARVESRVEHHRLRIPYSHVILQCYK